MNNHEDIRDKLAKLEALFARGATPGERAAVGAALGQMQARLDLAGANASEPEIELQYILPDVWAVRVFVALFREHESLAGIRRRAKSEDRPQGRDERRSKPRLAPPPATA